MCSTRVALALLAFTFLTTSLRAECAKNKDQRSSKDAGIQITDVTITGTKSLSTPAINRISSELIGSCFNDDADKIGERVRLLFQNRGFFQAVVNDLHMKPTDPLAHPKPVGIEADVTEGAIYKLADIRFVDNHAFSSATLRKVFPIRKGEVFDRDKIASGLEALRHEYGSAGYLDFTSMPNTQFLSDAAIHLTVTVIEGTQYHMGKLELVAKKEIADPLRAAWQLHAGAVFDSSYTSKYVHTNHAHLPPGFTEEQVQLVRNCPDAVVDIRLLVDATDPAAQSQPKEVLCEQPDTSTK